MGFVQGVITPASLEKYPIRDIQSGSGVRARGDQPLHANNFLEKFVSKKCVHPEMSHISICQGLRPLAEPRYRFILFYTGLPNGPIQRIYAPV